MEQSNGSITEQDFQEFENAVSQQGKKAKRGVAQRQIRLKNFDRSVDGGQFTSHETDGKQHQHELQFYVYSNNL